MAKVCVADKTDVSINANSVSGKRSFTILKSTTLYQGATSAVVHALELWRFHVDGDGSN